MWVSSMLCSLPGIGYARYLPSFLGIDSSRHPVTIMRISISGIVNRWLSILSGMETGGPPFSSLSHGSVLKVPRLVGWLRRVAMTGYVRWRGKGVELLYLIWEDCH